MNTKELKSLSRSDLLEMLIMQTDRVERMEIELEEAKRKAEARDIIIAKSGTLAEAAMQINEVWKAADQAAAQYLGNVLRMYDEQEQKYAQLEKEYAQRSKELMADSVQKAEDMLSEAEQKLAQAEQKAQELIADATQKSEAMMAEAAQKSDAMMAEAAQKSDALLAEATQKCTQLEQQTQAECDAMLQKAQTESKAYWDTVYEKLEQYCAAQESLKALLQAKG